VDITEAKDRIAMALVESIFRRARYQVTALLPERTRFRFVRDDIVPRLSINVVDATGAEHDVPIGVAYKPFVEAFIALENQRRDSSLFAIARRRCPLLQLILVTDHPAPGRSHFQALAQAGTEGLRTVDLASLAHLRLFPHNLTDHETLLRRIFSLLSDDQVGAQAV
jgi:hypothetical protein